MINRGEVYWVDLEPIRGHEIAKKRPGVIVSRQTINEHSDVIVVCPLTDSYGKTSKMHVFVPAGEANLEKDSIIHCGQIRAIDKSRLGTKMGELTPATIEKVNNGLEYTLSIC